MKYSAFLFALVLAVSPVFGEQISFYLGTYTQSSPSKGIYQGTLDTATGKLGPLALVAETHNPSFLALGPDKNRLYVVDEKMPGTGLVESFKRSPDGSLAPLNEQSAGGLDTCHLSVDPSGRCVLVANYFSGNVGCFRLQPDGSIGPRSAVEQFTGTGPNAKRQEGPHAHSIYVSADDAFVYSCDLGSDHIWILRLDAATGSLTPADPPSVKLPPGSGPRHLVFSAGEKLVYVSNELGQSVMVLARNSSTGGLTLLQTIDTLPAGTPADNVTVAEIALHPSGKWLYVSNRGPDTISVFAVESNGRLKFIQSVPAGVNWPRSFAIDPTGRWIISAGQRDNRIAVLKIDPASGRLSVTAESSEVGSPVCVLFEGKPSP